MEVSDIVGRQLETDAHPHEPTTQSFAGLDARVDEVLKIALETSTEVIKHSGTSRKHDVLVGERGGQFGPPRVWISAAHVVQPSSNIDWGILDDTVDHLGQRSEKVGRGDFGVEEDLRRKESLVSHVDRIFL